MKKLIIITLVFFVAIINFNCEKQAPSSPVLNQSEMPQLAKTQHESTPFTACALNWFVVNEEPGEYTFAQFDPDDSDVTVRPDGTVILRNRRLKSPIGGDLENSLTDAINVLIHAKFNPENGNGEAHGTISINATWNGLTGTFKGNFTGGFFQHWFSAEFYAQGKSGDFLGMKMKGTMIESEVPEGECGFKLEGHIFN